MANAYTAALGSLSVTPPPGVPNPYMASQPNVDDLAVFAAGGMGTTFSSNEKKVVMPYLAMPWADGHHTQFKNGDIVFVSRHHEHGDLRHNIVELNKLNQVLRLGFDIYLKAFDGGYESIRDNDDDDDDMDTDSPFHFDNLYHLDHNSTDIRQNLLFDIRSRYRSAATLAKKSGALPSAESIFFHSSLHKYRLPGVDDNSSDELDLSLNVRIERSLKELRGQNLYKAAGADQKFLDSLVLGGTDAEDRAYQEVLDILLEQRMGLARYATNFAIGRHWNLLGIVNNTAEGKGLQSLNSLIPNVGNAPVVNVVLENRTRTFNRWGDVKENSHLFLYETRRCISRGESWEDTKWGEYQIRPWSTIMNEEPPIHLLLHKDLNGHDAIGRVWNLGKVDRRTGPECTENLRLTACGLLPEYSGNASPPLLQEAFNAKGKLDMLEIFFNAL